MASRPRPYRFPALPAEEGGKKGRGGRCTTQSCGRCGASAVADCVALCCCPCALVSCLTLALVKAPYVAGRRCVARLARRRLRKAMRVRDLDYYDDGDGSLAKLAPAPAPPRRSKEWGDELAGVGAEARAKVSSRADAAAEQVWADMYQVGFWGFGRLSFSAAGAGAADSGEDGENAAE